MTSTWTHRYVATKPVPRDVFDSHPCEITVTAGLHHVFGNPLPHFSVTANISTVRGGDVMGGCLHDEILRYWPELAPVVALHLSDSTGAPMHDVANAAYWLGLTEWQTASVRKPDGTYVENEPLPYLPYVASHLRITEDEARNLHAHVATGAKGLTRLAAYVDLCRERWQREANEACALLDSLIGEQPCT